MEMLNQEDVDLMGAPPFDVHRWSDFPEVNAPVAQLVAEVKSLYQARGEQFREPEQGKRYIKVLVLDLWAAVKLGETPWRAIPRDAAQYRKGSETRYRKIHLKHRIVKFIDALIELGYVEQRIGFQDYRSGHRVGLRSRISALPKLIQLIDDLGLEEAAKKVGYVNVLTPMTLSPDTGRPIEPSESIRLKNTDGELVDYLDTRLTNQMRSNLCVINGKISEAKVRLHLTNDQFESLREVLRGKRNAGNLYSYRRTVNFERNSLYRVFNGSFELGGRFYGGWWEEIPREFRPYITINHQSVVELDYSGHHVRMLYAQEGLQMPDDPYDLDGFDRDDQKTAVMIILNASVEDKALRALASEGIVNGRELLDQLKLRHEPIAKHFHTGVGLGLQNKDAKIAEKLMLQMIHQSNATILPVHDSFLVSKGYEEELLEAMNLAFQADYKQAAKVKSKPTALELEQVPVDVETRESLEVNVFDPRIYLENYSTFHRIFGYK